VQEKYSHVILVADKVYSYWNKANSKADRSVEKISKKLRFVQYYTGVVYPQRKLIVH
jgi:hypothetical protein